MTDLPEFVYLVTVDTEWPVTVVVAYENDDAERVAQAVRQRVNHKGGRAHVWKARLADVREVDLIPSTVVKASIREREGTT